MRAEHDENQDSTSQSTASYQDNQQQYMDLDQLNRLKHQQAQKKIVEHIMFSGAPEDKKDNARSRMRKNLNKNNRKKNKPVQNTAKTDYDVEKSLRSILGNDYKPVHNKKSKKKRKRKKKRGQNQQETPPQEVLEERVKTPEERMHRTCVARYPGSSELEIDLKDEASMTVLGDCTKPGIQIPEYSLSFEASNTSIPRKHLFLTNVDKESIFGLPYQCEESRLICCHDEVADPLENFVNSWSAIWNPEQEEAPPREDEEGEDEREDADENSEEDDDDDEGFEFVCFREGGYEYFEELLLHCHAYETTDNCLCYAFGKEEDPKRFQFTYMSKASSTFIRKSSALLKSNLVVLNCNHLDKRAEEMQPGEISFKQLQPYVLDYPQTIFLLTTFDDTLPREHIHAHFTSLVNDNGLDLSNVILFLPPPLNESSV